FLRQPGTGQDGHFLRKGGTTGRDGRFSPVAGGVKVRTPDHFEKMRDHILRQYEGISVEHSFEDEAGQIWDCVPIGQQHSLKHSGAPLAKPIDLSALFPAGKVKAALVGTAMVT